MFPQNVWHELQQAKTRTVHKKCDNAEQHSPLVRRSSVKKRDYAALFCAISNQRDSPEILHTRGSSYATKQSVNAKHKKEVTENWKSMA